MGYGEVPLLLDFTERCFFALGLSILDQKSSTSQTRRDKPSPPTQVSHSFTTNKLSGIVRCR